jgi:hypothetical protein
VDEQLDLIAKELTPSRLANSSTSQLVILYRLLVDQLARDLRFIQEIALRYEERRPKTMV